ncbi:hypothetical protein CEXT_594271 [Caerostris extrusa]|uniref:Uncharacterized protein n=1 Tax=Caerostris extrusa TaxID=172846 RepID=A0AAV4VHQ8_CAEEX|nr:hypothetical protein CEXT_594271 [Caerostris extrusa]
MKNPTEFFFPAIYRPQVSLFRAKPSNALMRTFRLRPPSLLAEGGCPQITRAQCGGGGDLFILEHSERVVIEFCCGEQLVPLGE